MKQFTDMLGVPLNEGDFVVTLYNNESSHLYLAEILGFTQDFVRLRFKDDDWAFEQWEKKEVKRGKFNSMFIKVNKNDVTMYYLKKETTNA